MVGARLLFRNICHKQGGRGADYYVLIVFVCFFFILPSSSLLGRTASVSADGAQSAAMRICFRNIPVGRAIRGPNIPQPAGTARSAQDRMCSRPTLCATLTQHAQIACVFPCQRLPSNLAPLGVCDALFGGFGCNRNRVGEEIK